MLGCLCEALGALPCAWSLAHKLSVFAALPPTSLCPIFHFLTTLFMSYHFKVTACVLAPHQQCRLRLQICVCASQWWQLPKDKFSLFSFLLTADHGDLLPALPWGRLWEGPVCLWFTRPWESVWGNPGNPYPWLLAPLSWEVIKTTARIIQISKRLQKKRSVEALLSVGSCFLLDLSLGWWLFIDLFITILSVLWCS